MGYAARGVEKICGGELVQLIVLPMGLCYALPMKHVYTSSDPGQTAMIKAVLEEQGIKSLVKNEALAGGSFAFGYTNTWPEVWILDEARLEEAKTIVADWIQEEGENK